MRSILVFSFLVTAACGKSHDNFKGTAEGALDVETPAPRIAVEDATTDQCANGGFVYVVYAGEDVVNRQVLCNGKDGEDANTSPYLPVGIIHLCGKTGAYDEVLLRLANGEVMASFSGNANGQNTRLVFLPDGTYQTTDGRNCRFTLSTAGQTRGVTWDNQVQATWTIP